MITSGYDPFLVTVSVIIAVLASYAALGFAGRVTSASGGARVGWLLGGALVMGCGIWSMHFVGMLALELSVPVVYGLRLLLVSSVVAVAASVLALAVTSERALHWPRLLIGSVLMGAAISGMHYIGMASLYGPIAVTYDAALVTASILIAIVVSFAALVLGFRFRSVASSRGTLLSASSAVVLGIAIAGMHYTGMAAARFAAAPAARTSEAHVLATRELGEAIALGALVIIVLGIAGSVIERRWLAERASLTDKLAAQAAELARALEETERSRAAERAAHEARLKFVNMASHELRTPLGAIAGYTDLLLGGLRGPLGEQQGADVRRIQLNSKHLLRLINDMLDLAKLEAGQMPVHLTEVQLTDVLDAAAPMIEPQILEKGITYERKAEPGTPKAIADADRVQQIVINLVANAIKFTPPRGVISAWTRSDGSGIELCVHDTGPGIPEDKVGSLFTPFVQIGESAGKVGGTGLGLAVSRELARAMGGDLRVSGGQGRGATFILSLRAAGPYHA